MRQTKNSLNNSQIRELCGLAENGEPLEKIIKAMKTFEGHEGIGQKFMTCGIIGEISGWIKRPL